MKIPTEINELVTILRNNQCRVVFKKKDNTLRTMYCTLQEDKLPPKELVRNASVERRKNTEVIPVWDLVKKSWRSFRFNSIRDFNIQKEGDEL